MIRRTGQVTHFNFGPQPRPNRIFSIPVTTILHVSAGLNI